MTDAGHPDRRVYMKPSVFEKTEKKAIRQRDIKNERSLKSYMEETSTSHAPSEDKKQEWEDDMWHCVYDSDDDWDDWYDPSIYY